MKPMDKRLKNNTAFQHNLYCVLQLTRIMLRDCRFPDFPGSLSPQQRAHVRDFTARSQQQQLFPRLSKTPLCPLAVTGLTPHSQHREAPRGTGDGHRAPGGTGPRRWAGGCRGQGTPTVRAEGFYPIFRFSQHKSNGAEMSNTGIAGADGFPFLPTRRDASYSTFCPCVSLRITWARRLLPCNTNSAWSSGGTVTFVFLLWIQFCL